MAAAKPTLRQRIFRLVRIALRVFLALLLTGLALSLGVFLFLRSAWGQAQLLSWVLPVVQRSLHGSLHIGRFRSDLFHSLSIDDIALADSEGQPALRVGRIAVRYELSALRKKTLHITAVDVQGGWISARLLRDGQLNLATFLRPDPQPTPPATGPLPLAIVVEGIRVQAALAYAGGTGPLKQAAADLSLQAGLTVATDRSILVRIDSLSLPTTAPLSSQLALHGAVRITPTYEAPAKHPAANGPAPPNIALSDVVLTLQTDAAELVRVVPQAGLLPGKLAATLRVSGDLSKLTSTLVIELPKGSATLQADLGILDPKLPWQGSLRLHGIELATLRADLPPVRVELAVQGQGEASAGKLDLSQLQLQAGHNTLSLQGALTLPATPPIWQDPLSATAHLTLDIAAPRLDELHAVHALLPPLSGSLLGRVQLDVQDRALRIGSKLSGSGLSGFGATINQLQVAIDSPDLTALRGRIQLVLRDASYGSERIAQASLVATGNRSDCQLSAGLKGTIAGQALSARLALQALPIWGDDMKPQALTATLRELSVERGSDHLQLLSPATIRLHDLQTAPIIETVDSARATAQRTQKNDGESPQPTRATSLALGLAELRLFLSGRYEVKSGRLRGDLELQNIDAQHLAFVALGRTDVPRTHLSVQLHIAGSLAQPSGSAQLSGTVDPLPGVVPWQGPVSVQADVAGTLQDPRGSLALTIPAWQLASLQGESAALKLTYGERVLHVQAKVPQATTEVAPLGKVVLGAEVALDWRESQLAIDAGVQWNGAPWLHMQAQSQLSQAEALREGAKLLPGLPIVATLDIPTFSLPAGLPLSGRVGVHAEVKGTVAQPTAAATIQGNELQVGTWRVGSVWAQGQLDEKRVVHLQALLDPRSKATAVAPLLPTGDPTAVPPGVLSLTADVPLPFALTNPALRAQILAKAYQLDYEPEAGSKAALRRARGTLDAELHLSGAAPQPLAEGRLRLSRGEVAATTLPQLLREIAIDVQLSKEGRITLHQLFAKAAGGSLRSSGYVDLQGGQLRSLSLSSRAHDFPLAAGAYSVWLSTQVDVKGQSDGKTLRTRVDIPSGTVQLPKLSATQDMQALGPLADVEFVDAAGRKAQAAALAAQQAEEAEAHTHKAVPILPPQTLVTVEMPGPFVINGPEVKTDLQGHLEAELNSKGGTRGEPIIHGDLHAQSGWLEILGRRYQIDRAQVSLSGDVPPNPLLDVSISRKMEDATIYILVTGTAKKPVISFRSEPATYDQGQIMAMVLSGSSRGGGSIQQQALGALSSLLVGKLKDQLGAAVPVDVIKFDVGGSDAMGANQSSIEIGKYLRDNLYLSYTHRFGNPSTILRRMNNDQVALEWWFLRNYQIHLMGGDQGVGTLNLYWNKRF